VSRKRPFGHADERLHEWIFEARCWRYKTGQPGGTGGIDDALVRRHDSGIGAEIMGAGSLAGLQPAFHTPVFVLTQHVRPSIE